MRNIKTGLAATAVILVSVAGGVLGIALPAQANPVIMHAITGAVEDGTHDGETADDGVQNTTNDNQTADNQTADNNGVEDGTNDGETPDDASK